MSRTPSAADRTVLMFTGKTDLEDGLRSRDGSEGEERTSTPRKRPHQWVSHGLSEWRCDRLAAVIVRRGDSYLLEVKGRYIGDFPSLIEAVELAES